jgi:subtilisin family serine protease
MVGSGTSMAAPHVAGAAALYLQGNPTATPSQVADAILTSATRHAISGIDRYSPNLLLYTGSFAASTPAPTPDPVTTLPGTDAPPIASFAVNCAKNRCTFDASASTDDKGIVAYTWDFGDGYRTAATSGPKTMHTYPTVGTFTVTLLVTDASANVARSQQAVKVRKT